MEIEKLDELDLPEEIRTEIEETIKLNEDNSSVIDTQNKRINELEEQINITNKTLEEIEQKKSLEAKSKKIMEPIKEPITPVSEPEEIKEEPIVTPVNEPVKEPILVKPEEIKADGTVDFKAIEERVIKLENDKMVEKLNLDLEKAMKEFPNSVREKILIELANGSDKTVDELAKESHEAETKKIEELTEKIKKEQEVEITERVKKELAGGNVLPQSPASTSDNPNIGNSTVKKQSMNDAWAEAVQKARDEKNNS